MDDQTPWPHAPTHRLQETGSYFVTAGTHQKQHIFRSRKRLRMLQHELLTHAQRFSWCLEAWAVFSNHYHFVAHSPKAEADANSLSVFLATFHGKTSATVNRWDEARGRRVWHNYWDTRLTFERSYYARLHYVHRNAVHHGLVSVPSQYPWCSAGWFEQNASHAQVETIYGFKIDQLKVDDEFEVYRG